MSLNFGLYDSEATNLLCTCGTLVVTVLYAMGRV